MQLVPTRMKLLIATIGLACILPALSQKESKTRKFAGNPFLPTNVINQDKNPFLPVNPSIPLPKIIEGPTTSASLINPFLKRKPLTDTPIIVESRIPATASNLCKGPDLLDGICLPLTKCQPLMTKLEQNKADLNFFNFLRQSNEICGGEYAVVCCPSSNRSQQYTNEIPMRLPTVQEGCGTVNRENKKNGGDFHIQVVGGKDSKIRAWPWIALIGYDDGISSSPFKCGGALITSRHILTAAHCIRSDLTFVRLGEHDLSTDTETKHIDVPVSKTLKHPKYSRTDGRNDIALVYLAQDVKFTDKIGPVCLPITPTLRTKSFVDYFSYVAGWGRTMEGGSTATVLQELQIPVHNNSVCMNAYKKQNKLISQQQFDDSVICAGELKGGKDTCQGDSGGPLMISDSFEHETRFYMIGVVSYSIGCARPEIPGAYSNVAKFIDWIQQGIADAT